MKEPFEAPITPPGGVEAALAGQGRRPPQEQTLDALAERHGLASVVFSVSPLSLSDGSSSPQAAANVSMPAQSTAIAAVRVFDLMDCSSVPPHRPMRRSSQRKVSLVKGRVNRCR